MFAFCCRLPSRFVEILLYIAVVILIELTIMSVNRTLPLSVNVIQSFAVREEEATVSSSSFAVPKTERFFTLGFGGFRCCGTANQMFELVSGFALAKRLKRTFYIRVGETVALTKLRALSKVFPNILDYISIRIEKADEHVKHFNISGGKCCVYGNVSVLEAASHEPTIQVDNRYLQSFKYFDNISKEIDSSVLKFSAAIERTADEKLFGEDVLKSTNQRLCVHIRRGDYVNRTYVVWTTENYTAASVTFLANKIVKSGKNVSVLLFSDDQQWSNALKKSAFGKQPPFAVYVAEVVHLKDITDNVTAVVDIAFARKHCNVVLLTAPASTFGWWMAYLATVANNATVYYNEAVSPPNGVQKEMIREDFFPPHWNVLRNEDLLEKVVK